MTTRHWIWLATGLLCWALLVLVWTQGRNICDLPETRTTDHCQTR